MAGLLGNIGQVAGTAAQAVGTGAQTLGNYATTAAQTATQGLGNFFNDLTTGFGSSARDIAANSGLSPAQAQSMGLNFARPAGGAGFGYNIGQGLGNFTNSFTGALTGESPVGGSGVSGLAGSLFGDYLNQKAGGFPGLMSTGLSGEGLTGGGLDAVLQRFPQLRSAVRVLTGPTAASNNSGILSGGPISGLLSGRTRGM